VVVTREDVDPPDVFQVDLPATGSREEVRIPQQFLASGVEYKVEVLTIAASGNQTLTEHVFTVE
jgi:limonene-1,2-epoxide hydrolase